MKVSGTSNTFLSIYVIGIITFLSITLLFGFVNSAETQPKPMNLTITQTIGLTLSDKLAKGILYTNDTGAVSNVQYPVNTQEEENATWNYKSGSGPTYYNITNIGNTNEDICGKATTDLTCNPSTPGCGATTILIANATWSNSTSNTPPYPPSNIWNTSYVGNLTAAALPKDNTVHLRYWLNVPIVPAGIYNTTFTYCAVESGQTCSC